MSHDRFSELLLEHAYGELSPRDAREVEAHAAGCAECGAELARIRATRRTMGALPEERAPEAGERILLAAAREAARERAPGRILPRWFWSASAVAALFLAVGAVSYRLLALRPAAERPGEELLGHAQYAEAPRAPEAARAGESAPGAAAAPVEAPAGAASPPRDAKPAAPAKRRVRSLAARDEAARPAAAPAPAADAGAPAEARAYAAPPARAGDSLAEEAEGAGFAAPPERSREEPPRVALAAPRPQSAGAPAAAAAPAPEPRSRSAGAPAAAAAAAPAPERPAAGKAPDGGGGTDRADVAIERYAALRAAGALAGEIRTFSGCEGESWRKVERDAQGRTVKYVREGRVAGRRLRIEHLFGADGALASVRVSDLDRGSVLDAGALGLTLPRDASEAAPDAPPRCGR